MEDKQISSKTEKFKNTNTDLKERNSKDKKEGTKFPVFPFFDMLKIEKKGEIFLICAGGGGSPEYGKTNGVIIFKKKEKTIKGEDPFEEHLFYETENIVKRIFLKKKSEDIFLLIELSEKLGILKILKNKIELVGFQKNKNIFSFENNLLIRSKEKIISINYSNGIYEMPNIGEKEDNLLFFNFEHKISVFKKNDNFLINLDKKIFKTDVEIRQIFSFDKNLFLVSNNLVLFVNEKFEKRLAVKFCTKVSRENNKFVLVSGEGMAYIYEFLQNDLKLLWSKKLHPYGLTAACYDESSNILSYTSYDCTLDFIKVSYRKSYFFLLAFMILVILFGFYLFKKK